jgi:hypothetical protein
MVMKVRSFWKMLIGMVLSLFVGGGFVAKSDAKAASTESTKTTLAQASMTRKGINIGRLPTTGKVRISVANERVDGQWPVGASGVISLPAGARSRDAAPASQTDRTKFTPGNNIYHLILAPETFQNNIDIVSEDEANLPEYKNKTVVIIEKQDGTGYLRIPIAVPESEETLNEEYNQ